MATTKSSFTIIRRILVEKGFNNIICTGPYLGSTFYTIKCEHPQNHNRIFITIHGRVRDCDDNSTVFVQIGTSNAIYISPHSFVQDNRTLQYNSVSELNDNEKTCYYNSVISIVESE